MFLGKIQTLAKRYINYTAGYAKKSVSANSAVKTNTLQISDYLSGGVSFSPIRTLIHEKQAEALAKRLLYGEATKETLFTKILLKLADRRIAKNIVKPPKGYRGFDFANLFPDWGFRFHTAEEANSYAHKIVMGQFEAPFKSVRERTLTVAENVVYVGFEGSTEEALLRIIPKSCESGQRSFRHIHNHPGYNRRGDTFPLSEPDLKTMLNSAAESITALNKKGEFSTARVIDFEKADKKGISKELLDEIYRKKTIAYMKRKGKRLEELRNISEIYKEQNRKMPAKLQNELAELENLFVETEKQHDTIFEKYISKHPRKYARMLHNVYKEVLPKFGIEYETNFSNLRYNA